MNAQALEQVRPYRPTVCMESSYCKTVPHLILAVMLDSMGIRALLGQVCPNRQDTAGHGFAVEGAGRGEASHLTPRP